MVVGARIVAATVLASLLLVAAPANAVTLYVDGACSTSGDGTSATCGGATGALRTVGEGIDRMCVSPNCNSVGDTLNVRGAHDGFDGKYFEMVWMANNRPAALAHGKALSCPSGSHCTLRGCPAGACNGNTAQEQPIVTTARLVNDWNDAGGGIWWRNADAQPVLITQNGQILRQTGDDAAYDPRWLWDTVKGDFLGYTVRPCATDADCGTAGASSCILNGVGRYCNGDDDHLPTEDHWSFDTTLNRLWVHPLGGADPTGRIEVPLYQETLNVLNSNYVTFDHMTFDGARTRVLRIGAAGGGSVVNGIELGFVGSQRTASHLLLSQNTFNGWYVHDSLFQYCGRGVSHFESGSDGCFGSRMFSPNGGTYRRNHIQHMGASGIGRPSGTQGPTNMPWGGAYLQAPWNDRNYTRWSGHSEGVQAKQGFNVMIADNEIGGDMLGGSEFDVTRFSFAINNHFHDSEMGFSNTNFTPVNGCCNCTTPGCNPVCPSQDPGLSCYATDNVIDGNRFARVGTSGSGAVALSLTGNSGTQVPSDFVFGVHAMNNTFVDCGWAAIYVGAEDNNPTQFLVANNSINGHRTGADITAGTRGIVCRNAADASVIFRNNIVNGVTNEDIATATDCRVATFDYDLVNGGSTQARWDATISPPNTNPGTVSGGTSGTLAQWLAALGDEAHGLVGDPLFVSSQDLHLQAGSPAIDTGESEASYFTDDMDSTTRVDPWDRGADDANGSGTTTSTVTSTTSTTVTTTTGAPTTTSSSTTTSTSTSIVPTSTSTSTSSTSSTTTTSTSTSTTGIAPTTTSTSTTTTTSTSTTTIPPLPACREPGFVSTVIVE